VKKFLNPKFLLSIIVIIAAVLRFYGISNKPPGLNWDEAAWGYNSYSLGVDLKDEFGKLLPLTYIESYGDYKPPVYAYLGIVPVKFFGLNELGVRFPSAFFGTFTVLLTYFLVKEIFAKNKSTELLALTSAFFLAISPWHIMLSRGAFEANVSTFFIVLGIFAFLRSINKNAWWFFLSSVSFALSLYTFNTARVFVPLLVLVLAFVFRKKLLSNKKQTIISFLVGLILVLPLIPFLLSPQAKLRYEEVNIFSNLEIVKVSNKEIANDGGAVWSKVIHNRRFIIGQTYVGNYLSHFDFNFLFTKGDDNFRHHIQNMGMLYLFEFPLILFGIYQLIKNRSQQSIFILSWLLIAPIAASPATPNPHANRSLPLIIALEIIAAYSLVYLNSQKFVLKKTLIFAISLWIISSFLIYLHNYYVHYPIEKASFWQYGYKEAVVESERLKDQYEKIYVDHSLEQAYIFWLFNTKYDPKNYQASGSRNNFDKYYFDAKIPQNRNELFISDSGNFPSSLEVIKTIYYPDGTEVIKIGRPR